MHNGKKRMKGHSPEVPPPPPRCRCVITASCQIKGLQGNNRNRSAPVKTAGTVRLQRRSGKHRWSLWMIRRFFFEDEEFGLISNQSSQGLKRGKLFESSRGFPFGGHRQRQFLRVPHPPPPSFSCLLQQVHVAKAQPDSTLSPRSNSATRWTLEGTPLTVNKNDSVSHACDRCGL